MHEHRSKNVQYIATRNKIFKESLMRCQGNQVQIPSTHIKLGAMAHIYNLGTQEIDQKKFKASFPYKRTFEASLDTKYPGSKNTM